MAQWIIDEEHIANDDYEHHKCSNCNELALFEYTTDEMWDENLDGEYEFICMIDTGINEHLTKFCPSCGAKMSTTVQSDSDTKLPKP